MEEPGTTGAQGLSSPLFGEFMPVNQACCVAVAPLTCVGVISGALFALTQVSPADWFGVKFGIVFLFSIRFYFVNKRIIWRSSWLNLKRVSQ